MESTETQTFQDSKKRAEKPSPIVLEREGIVDVLPNRRIDTREKMVILWEELAAEETKLLYLRQKKSSDTSVTYSKEKACLERIDTIKKELESYRRSMELILADGFSQKPSKRFSMTSILTIILKFFSIGSKTK